VPTFDEVKEQFRQRARQQQIQKLLADLRSKAMVGGAVKTPFRRKKKRADLIPSPLF
jgi:hypothetical protein